MEVEVLISEFGLWTSEKATNEGLKGQESRLPISEFGPRTLEEGIN